jgi:hypothetical protein
LLLHQSPSYSKKTKVFEWIIECQITWEDIKNWYIQAPILISGRSEFNSYKIIPHYYNNIFAVQYAHIHNFYLDYKYTCLYNSLKHQIHGYFI